MSNQITIELCAEDRARIDKLMESMSSLDVTLCAASGLFSIRATQTPSDAPADAQPQEKTEAAKVPTPAQDAAETRTEPTEGTAYKLADVQQLVVRLCSPEIGMKAQVREIIKAYAPKVTDIPEAKYGEVMVKLKALEQSGDVPF